MRIKKFKISNFRSIVKLEIKIDENNNFICFCGANNVGKTNILNALSLFFGKSDYDPEKDCPNHKFFGTRGGHYQPKIEVVFKDNKDIYQITRDWNKNKEEFSGKKNKNKLSAKEVSDFINKINFFYLPSINMSFPEAIKYIMNSDIIDLETGKTRMSGKKGEMKNAIEKVLGDLKFILDSLGEHISPLLDKYKEGWGVAFDISSEVNSFRDLMIGEIDFYIKDKSNSKAIDAKGSGLQRLCHILMYFRIIEKLNEKKQKVILCIDEPNVYLHSGLQKKLLEDIKEKSLKNQIFITTHSSIFIDTIKLSNVFLLDQKIEEKQYQRAKRKTEDKKFNAIETHLVNFGEANGISTLKNYLGIDDKDNLLFDKYNILVEGDDDKIYLSKLMSHFGIAVPNIIPCNGADNIIKHLEFYNSMADSQSESHFLAILDNDAEGRKVDEKIKPQNYTNIKVEKKFIIANSGFVPPKNRKGTCNADIEIEDFLKPAIVCYLVNEILKKKSLKYFSKKNVDDISTQITQPAFQNNGILALIENKKNELNPTTGQSIQINGEGVKWGMANIFNNLDNNLIGMIGDINDSENVHIKNFLEEIAIYK